ncbi:class IIc cyclic bacteriocin [Bacillus cereus]|nr:MULTISPECIES: class IIc cyclic bacteriocin [Bacillus cereus group]MDZ4411866.1 class IIc cyclic bacteriocin [Bacillus cereus]MEB8879709.1 class IIc cyclic bacteriocin [Bacillus cereus]MEB9619125.1 class IIc cyclic bacteriocin [Bacillus cereus]MEB9643691.1 class IIc cyclic bacteriocin [Bacillus cereus]MEB9649958.1 class IIc cyclic bacteriocin [Bacillus cereus]
MQLNFLRQHLNLSKWEIGILSTVLASVAMLSMNIDINFICDQMGITISGPTWRKLTDWVAAGGSLGTGFALIVGITLPAWILEAAAAFGIYAA